MHSTDLILTLTSGLVAALICGYAAFRCGLSPITGYLVGGIIVGPSTPGFAADRELAQQLAEIGVILLMFGVGLNFHLDDLLAVRRIAVPGALVQIVVATALGVLTAVLCGWGVPAGFVFGLAISVASTVVLLRVLADSNDLHSPTGHIAIGWVVVEDLFVVVVLVMLPVLFRLGDADVSAMTGLIAWAILKIGFLILFIGVVGRRVLPWLLTKAAATHSRELFVLTVLVLALGIAVGAARLFGASMALGAFLAGMVVGRSDFSSRAASEALPLRDAFAVLFFVSVGMLFRPSILVEAPVLIIGVSAMILLIKPIVIFLIMLFFRYPVGVSATVAGSLAQLGEFSFIVAGLGRELDAIPERAASAIIAVALVAISLNPLFYRLSQRVDTWIGRWPDLAHRLQARSRSRLIHLARESDDELATVTSRAVVVGYGPVGRTLVRLLQENDIEPTIIELNIDTVGRLRLDGYRAVYGDATHKATLEEAGIQRATVMILTSAGMKGAAEVIRVARELNPRIKVLARTAYLREGPILRKGGADAVFTGEGEVALSMTEFLLRNLGATDEQIDREGQRMRSELFGDFMAIEILLPPPAPRESTK
ncbi:MAG: cation:proton antiporter [Gemmataceae bacterium]|nr:cation:proton antiporter [Gemmataceae bacterium]